MVLLGWSGPRSLLGLERNGFGQQPLVRRVRSGCCLCRSPTEDGCVRKFEVRQPRRYALQRNGSVGLVRSRGSIGREDRYVQGGDSQRRVLPIAAASPTAGCRIVVYLTSKITPAAYARVQSMQGLRSGIRPPEPAGMIWIAGAQKLADAQLRIMSAEGFLPGRQRHDFTAAVDWCCLTGSAQTSAVWSQLYLLGHDEKYRTAAEVRKRDTSWRVTMFSTPTCACAQRLARLLAGVGMTMRRLQILNWA